KISSTFIVFEDKQDRAQVLNSKCHIIDIIGHFKMFRGLYQLCRCNLYMDFGKWNLIPERNHKNSFQKYLL
uniref:hypothetical protein n=1 Tax=Salmonella sp. s58078 TaxID=3159699 RepID=UPI0039813B3E